MTTDQGYNHRRPWNDRDAALIRNNLHEFVGRAASTIGRSHGAVQCQIMRELGVSQKEIGRIVRSRQRRSPLTRAFDSVWDVTNHQVVGGLLLALVVLVGGALWSVLT
jgi:hypothetical protein